MAWAPSLPDLIGIAAGLAILAVGTFVLLAKPRSWLHRLFFLLGVADGVSTMMFHAVGASNDAATAALYDGMYWYYYIAFLGLLAAFGVLFPLPPRRRALAGGLVLAVALGSIAAIALYASDHSLFRVVEPVAAGIRIRPTALGNALNVTFVAVTALLVAKLTRDVRAMPAGSHRRQSALVLGGMTLAYAPYPLTVLAQALPAGASGVLFAARADLLVAYWTFAVFAACVAASAWLLASRARGAAAHDARFVLGCYAGVLVLTLVATLSRELVVGYALRGAALLAYPILLGYAIARYEVFDIDRRMRRAATATLVAAGLTVTFIIGENLVEELVAQRLAVGISSQFVSGATAALLTAAIFIPVVRGSRRVAQKVVPELTIDELHERKLEVYRHSLAGALADGLIAERESRTLRALREALAITPEEHERILHDLLHATAASNAPQARGSDAA